MPSPQASTVQSPRQPSPAAVLPSSQASLPVTTPLPHAVGVQLASQPSPLWRSPSSQTSLGSTMPSPQIGWHATVGPLAPSRAVSFVRNSVKRPQYRVVPMRRRTSAKATGPVSGESALPFILMASFPPA